MAVFRVNKTKNFTVMSNHHLRDKNLSFKAKGLLSQMLSLPEEWDYSIAGLVATSKENETAVKSTLNELKEAGYLRVTKLMPNQTGSGRIEYIYDIYEQPYDKQAVEKQGVEVQGVEFQAVEYQGQRNKEKRNTEKEIQTKKDGRFRKPTAAEVREYCRERGNKIDAEYFVDYYETRGWLIGKSRMKDWKAAVRTWERYEKKDKPKEERLDDLDDIL